MEALLARCSGAGRGGWCDYHSDVPDSPSANLASLVSSNPKVMGGTLVFVGSRVPVATMFEHLEAGDSLDVFLDDFPTVTREQAVAVISVARTALESRASAA